jgi:hypothetical protein
MNREKQGEEEKNEKIVNKEFEVLDAEDKEKDMPLSKRKKKQKLSWYTVCMGILVIE